MAAQSVTVDRREYHHASCHFNRPIVAWRRMVRPRTLVLNEVDRELTLARLKPGSEEERHESMVALHTVNRCACPSARCVCPTAISSHARRAFLSAGASDLFGTAPRRARVVCHLGQIYRSKL